MMTTLLRVFFALALGSISTVASAATVVTVTESASTLPGHVLYELAAESTSGDIVGFDFFGPGGTFGFFGPMNQINPAGNPSIFNDANGFFGSVGADVTQDSQFTLPSTVGLTLPSTLNEGTGLLQAMIAFTRNPQSGLFSFAQIAAPTEAQVVFQGQFTIDTGNGFILEDVIGTLPAAAAIPEPTSFGLAGLAIVASSRLRRRA